MRVTPYCYTPAKPRPRLAIPHQQEPSHYIASFDRLNHLKPGVAYIIGGTRYPNV
ncbi:MAG: hypothetical protein GX466_08870 [Candidatus Cloacimonetes bacterium]|nr:hypothetical protein [Candidatus Cloacimonadota bacterium]